MSKFPEPFQVATLMFGLMLRYFCARKGRIMAIHKNESLCLNLATNTMSLTNWLSFRKLEFQQQTQFCISPGWSVIVGTTVFSQIHTRASDSQEQGESVRTRTHTYIKPNENCFGGKECVYVTAL